MCTNNGTLSLYDDPTIAGEQAVAVFVRRCLSRYRQEWWADRADDAVTQAYDHVIAALDALARDLGIAETMFAVPYIGQEDIP